MAPSALSLTLSVILLAGCPAQPAPQPTPASPLPAEIVDMASYLTACEAELGPWPEMHCDDAVEVPVTVTDADGTRVVTQLDDLEGGARCDRSSIGGCAPGTRIGVSTTAEGGVFVYGCRTYDDDPAFDQINVVATHAETGATCFFSTKHRDQEYGDGTVWPRPGSDEDLSWFDDRPFWYTLDDLRSSSCLECHDNDAILHNPWIRQIDVLPDLDPYRPYTIVGQDALIDGGSSFWTSPADLVHPDAQPCLACHRLSDRRSCDLALEATGRDPRGLTTRWFAETYPWSRWMSTFDDEERSEAWPTEADWEEEWGAAADTIAQCCSDDPAPECFSAR